MKIKEFKGFRCKYGLNLRVEFPVFFVLDLFLGEMGRGYGKLPLEDNRVCPWTWRFPQKPLLGACFWEFVFGSACKMGILVSQK